MMSFASIACADDDASGPTSRTSSGVSLVARANKYGQWKYKKKDGQPQLYNTEHNQHFPLILSHEYFGFNHLYDEK